MIHVIIAGSRHFQDYDRLKAECDKLLCNHTEVEVISGKAPGADTLGERYAAEKGYPVKPFPADWTTYGNAAGPLRNEQMAIYASNCDKSGCIVFSSGGAGSASMIRLAGKYNIKTKIVKI